MSTSDRASEWQHGERREDEEIDTKFKSFKAAKYNEPRGQKVFTSSCGPVRTGAEGLEKS